MTECATFDEFNEKFRRNNRLTGSGRHLVAHVPCPFCAEPDWLIYMVSSAEAAEAAYTKGATCAACGRGARVLVLQAKPPSPPWWEFIQTAGPNVPAWFHWEVRREA